MKEFAREHKILLGAIISGILAIVFFVGIHGSRVINPLDTGLCNASGWLTQDLEQHYYGWLAFRNAPWTFPLGMFDTVTYPDKVSMIFADCIPLLAIIGKLFSFVLPAQFQYFGIYGVLCYILIALISYRILNRYTKKTVYSIIGSLFFLIAPILLHRTMVHEALASQWILLWAIDMLLRIDKNTPKKKLYGELALLSFFASTIHMYYVLLCGVVLVGMCIKNICEEKSVRKTLTMLSIYIGEAAAIIFSLGGFSSGYETSDPDMLGAFNANLDTFINPMSKSSIMYTQPLYNYGQVDGTGYLGVGVIIACVVAVAIIFGGGQREMRLCSKYNVVAGAIICAIAFTIAVSPIVAFDEHLLFEFSVPTFVAKIWSNFRCYGRLTWICVMIFMLFSFIVIGRYMKKSWATIFIAGLLILQVFDVHGTLREKYEFCNNYQQEIDLNTYSEMQAMAEDDTLQHVVIWRSFLDDGQDAKLTAVYMWAINNGKTVNRFYLARDDRERFFARTEKALDNIDDSNLYVFQVSDEELCKEKGLYYTIEGDYIFARSIPIQ